MSQLKNDLIFLQITCFNFNQGILTTHRREICTSASCASFQLRHLLFYFGIVYLDSLAFTFTSFFHPMYLAGP